MLSMVLAQHMGLILTQTQWQQSLPLWTCSGMSLNFLAPSPSPLGMERGVTHTNLPVLLQRGCDGLQTQDCETPALVEPTVPTGEHAAALHCLCCSEREEFILNHEFFTLFTYCVSFQMISESLASAWNSAFCEVQSAVGRNCFTLWKKPAYIASPYD